MKKIELVYKEILDSVIEKKKRFTQADISRKLDISLSTVNHALDPLKNMGCIKIGLRFFDVLDAKKILYYWSSIRNLDKDLVYKTRVNKDPSDIEKNMPGDIVFAGYSAYKFMFKKIPADYSEVYVYIRDSKNLKELEKRFPKNNNTPNLFVLKGNVDKMTLSHIFADIWNMKEWYAKDFLNELEVKIHGLLA